MTHVTHKLFLAGLTVFLLMFTFSQVAEAKRFGGGKSFGYSKQVAPKSFNKSSQSNAAKKPAQPAAAPAGQAGKAAKPASGASKWLGPLAGLAAGGLLAAMIFGDGFEGIQIMDILLFALIAFVLFKLFTSRARQQGAYQSQHREAYQGQDQGYQPPPVEPKAEPQMRQATQSPQPAYDPDAQSGSIFGADLEDGMGQGVSENAKYLNEIPAWFDSEQFIEGAKSHFVTLQKAWDNVDLKEIESYCTTQLFSALQQELSGVQPGDNQTRVDTLDAEIAAMAVDGEFFVVSVRFSGFIEEGTAGAHAFNEIWHIRRLASDEGNWLVAGIQQTNDLP